MNRCDNHSHIIHAGIKEMVGSAGRKLLDEYSITEHVSQFSELRRLVRFGSVHSSGRLFESLDEYLDEFENLRAEPRRVRKLNQGLEVDFSPHYIDKVGDFVNRRKWDILLCSVHEFGDGRDIERMGRHARKAEHRWEAYFQLQSMALESEFIPFQVLAHPVRIARSGANIPDHVDEMLINLARTAKKSGRALELNGNDIDYNLWLVRRLAMACAKIGCSVSLGSDAHYPNDVFRNMDVAMGLVEELKLVIA